MTLRKDVGKVQREGVEREVFAAPDVMVTNEGIYCNIKKIGCPILHAIYLHLCVCVAAVKGDLQAALPHRLRSASITPRLIS